MAYRKGSGQVKRLRINELIKTLFDVIPMYNFFRNLYWSAVIVRSLYMFIDLIFTEFKYYMGAINQKFFFPHTFKNLKLNCQDNDSKVVDEQLVGIKKLSALGT